jgi:hypothetical protein
VRSRETGCKNVVYPFAILYYVAVNLLSRFTFGKDPAGNSEKDFVGNFK